MTAVRIPRHRRPEDRRVAAHWRLLWSATVAALLALLGLSALQSPGLQRWIVIALTVLAILLMGLRTDAGVRIALLLLPFVGLIRRLTSGPSGYTLNDPLALLAIAAMIPAALMASRRFLAPSHRIYTVLVVWLVLGGAYGIVGGTPVITAAYGVVTAVVPVVIALKVSVGMFPGLPAFFVRALPITGAAVGAYGVAQWLAPAEWDLAWLRTQQAALISVGFPEQGQFRIWATTESPGIAALVLGAAACVALPQVVRSSTPLPTRLLLAAALAPIFFALVLTQVRTGLFAVPIAVVCALLLDRKVKKVVVLPVLAALVVVGIVVPPLLSSSDEAGQRYDVANIAQDRSFKDRQELLPQFATSVVQNPLGSGSGATQLGQRLGASGSATTGAGNIDNGYLTRLIETGVPGAALFVMLLVLAARRLRDRMRAGTLRAIDAACVAVVVFFLLTEFSGPSTSSPVSILFWLPLGILTRDPSPRPDVRQQVEAGKPAQTDGLDAGPVTSTPNAGPGPLQ